MTRAGSELAQQAVAQLRAQGRRLAIAESLTGGLLCAALVDVPGASDVVVGAIVAYAPEVKTGLLGVAEQTVRQHGTVAEQTAAEMAMAALDRVDGATIAVSTTGVAGPEPSEGKQVGTVCVGLADQAGVETQRCAFTGERGEIRAQTVAVALGALTDRLARSNGTEN